MKPTQTVLLLVILVVMIFAVTFASMYLRDKDPLPDSGKNVVTPGEKKDGKEGANLQLTFRSTHYPEELGDVGKRLVSEYGRHNHYDFWFLNEHDAEVKIGLNTKNCTCTDVSVHIAPREWLEHRARVLGETLPLLAVQPDAYVTLADQLLREKGRAVDQKHMQVLDPGTGRGVAVPPHSQGFVRMRWEGKRSPGVGPKRENLTSQIWSSSQRSGLVVDLQVATLLVDPVFVDQPDLNFGEIGDSARGSLRCWSAIHKTFKLKADSTGKPFVTCGEPQPLPPLDLEKLREQFGVVEGGYLLPVEVQGHVEGGKRQMDIGPFQHQVTITPVINGTDLEPLTVTVTGEVKGEIQILGGRSGIGLGSFPVKLGTTHTVTLTTDRTDLELQVDKVPPFLKARLAKNEALSKSTGRPHWNLTVDIEPNKVSGKFPRPDHPAFRDSSISLKATGSTGRGMRIPVFGEARQ